MRHGELGEDLRIRLNQVDGHGAGCIVGDNTAFQRAGLCLCDAFVGADEAIVEAAGGRALTLKMRW